MQRGIGSYIGQEWKISQYKKYNKKTNVSNMTKKKAFSRPETTQSFSCRIICLWNKWMSNGAFALPRHVKSAKMIRHVFEGQTIGPNGYDKKPQTSLQLSKSKRG